MVAVLQFTQNEKDRDDRKGAVERFTTMQFGKRDVPNVTNALCFKKLSILFVLTVTVMHAQLVRVATPSGRLARAPSAPFISGSFFVVTQ